MGKSVPELTVPHSPVSMTRAWLWSPSEQYLEVPSAMLASAPGNRAGSCQCSLQLSGCCQVGEHHALRVQPCSLLLWPLEWETRPAAAPHANTALKTLAAHLVHPVRMLGLHSRWSVPDMRLTNPEGPEFLQPLIFLAVVPQYCPASAASCFPHGLHPPVAACHQPLLDRGSGACSSCPARMALQHGVCHRSAANRCAVSLSLSAH